MDCFISHTNNWKTRGTTWQKFISWKKKFYEILFIMHTSKEVWHVLWLQIHVMTKELIRLGMTLAHHLPLNLVDKLLVMAAYLIFGDLSQHGITRPKMGPMTLKSETGRSAVIDVGTVGLIKKGIIKVSMSLTWHKFITYVDLICQVINVFLSPKGSREH